MNIITNYQAQEIAKKSLEKRRKLNYDLMCEFCERYKSFKSYLNKIFNGIKENAEKGESACFIEISYKQYQDNTPFYEGLARVLLDGFAHLGYITSAKVDKNKLEMWIEWYER